MNNSRYIISTDKTQLDVMCIHDFLANQSYWACNRSLETVKTAIENSLCFGVYQDQELVGFARVITDYAVFAYLLDVFVVESHRKKGVGKFLVQTILDHTGLRNVKRWMLGTQDAHGLYQQYGFRKLKDPDLFMEWINPGHM